MFMNKSFAASEFYEGFPLVYNYSFILEVKYLNAQQYNYTMYNTIHIRYENFMNQMNYI